MTRQSWTIFRSLATCSRRFCCHREQTLLRQQTTLLSRLSAISPIATGAYLAKGPSIPHRCCSFMSDGPVNKKTRTMTELEKFDEVFPKLVGDLTNSELNHPEIGDAVARFKEVCEYNVPFGKKNRGLSVVQSYKLLVESSQHTEENLFRARVLGWCVEWLQAYFLVADDIMDHSLTRRGQPCWYKREDVGMMAINDSYFLERAIYILLKKYFRDEAYYVDLLELFHEVTLQTVQGQELDILTAPENRVDFTNFTIERYSAIVKWKTAFYSFYLPVALAMYMAGIKDSEYHANAKIILLQMGHFFQVQDDYLDCFGDPSVTGKIGTDIEDNKCGWLIVQALKRATNEQRKILESNYAQNDKLKVERVKTLYNELNLKKVYSDYEEESYADLMVLIKKYSKNLPEELFTTFAQKIYKRKK